ncbi:MAG: 3-phosphoshikimate 1-carboxyvinyltransferase [Coriobacteriia bacterium]|nr:3-phosphoshikimate 1-carboxyvinyltransferase [Coriobacteriia bacterium]MCL2750887.1 3-phosphoshikimate 1-carboxyvinyltransferase [Coriobacteriia bacterium]
MKAKITPAPLSGTIEAIASKSDAHRQLICAAFADGPTELQLKTSSEDIETTADCLRALGAGIEQRSNGLLVSPITKPPAEVSQDCAESGSTLRFMLPVAAANCEQVHFTGRGRLPERPLGELVKAMLQNGVEFSSNQLPFTTRGKLQIGSFSLPGNISSQYITGLLLALAALEGTSEIILTTPLESKDYVNITLRVLELYGVDIQQEEDRFIVPGGQQFKSPGKVAIEGDWSNAAFFLAAGALSLGVPTIQSLAEGDFSASLTVAGISPNSPQGDRNIVSLLKLFGAELTQDDNQVRVFAAPLRGTTIDIGETPDLLPVLAVVAACALGETRFTNAARLRLKESDRLETTAALLRSLGGQAEELPQGLLVRGGKLTGGVVESFNDHRIAMAAAVAAIACTEPVIINNAEAVAKSYPAFFTDYQKLGGAVHVI